MKTTILLLSSLVSAGQSALLGQSTVDEAYINSVCSPKTKEAPLPPCVSIVNIENQCMPNGTAPINYLAHAQCMCSPPSSFFADWRGCQNCQLAHGARSEQDINKAFALISSASNALCTGTPTARFRDLYSTLDNKAAVTLSGATTSNDRAPSQTAVSIYYTASGVQGPGVIAGAWKYAQFFRSD
jgi:hypothetical protein